MSDTGTGRGLMVVLSRPLPGREAEFDAWYARNLALICEPEGVMAASFYRMSATQLPGQQVDPEDRVAIYALNDPAAALARMQAHQREYNGAVDPGTIRGFILDEVAAYQKP